MMVRTALLAGATLLAAGAAGAHSITVVGADADAIACYRGADSDLPNPAALDRCTTALTQGDLLVRDEMATHVNRGIVLFRLERFGEAVADFDAALALAPGQPDALINKGITLLAAGAEIGDAMALIERGLAGDPQRPWVGYYGRAVAHELAGRDADAYRDYKRAQELRPSFRPANQALTRFAVVGG